jgi:hypothetical protein
MEKYFWIDSDWAPPRYKIRVLPLHQHEADQFKFFINHPEYYCIFKWQMELIKETSSLVCIWMVSKNLFLKVFVASESIIKIKHISAILIINYTLSFNIP